MGMKKKKKETRMHRDTSPSISLQGSTEETQKFKTFKDFKRWKGFRTPAF
jgi:hypothetical protein